MKKFWALSEDKDYAGPRFDVIGGESGFNVSSLLGYGLTPLELSAFLVENIGTWEQDYRADGRSDNLARPRCAYTVHLHPTFWEKSETNGWKFDCRKYARTDVTVEERNHLWFAVHKGHASYGYSRREDAEIQAQQLRINELHERGVLPTNRVIGTTWTFVEDLELDHPLSGTVEKGTVALCTGSLDPDGTGEVHLMLKLSDTVSEDVKDSLDEWENVLHLSVCSLSCVRMEQEEECNA